MQAINTVPSTVTKGDAKLGIFGTAIVIRENRTKAKN